MDENKRYMDIHQLMKYTSLGRCTAANIGREAGAVIHVGRRVVFDKVAIDRYMETLHA